MMYDIRVFINIDSPTVFRVEMRLSFQKQTHARIHTHDVTAMCDVIAARRTNTSGIKVGIATAEYGLLITRTASALKNG